MLQTLLIVPAGVILRIVIPDPASDFEETDFGLAVIWSDKGCAGGVVQLLAVDEAGALKD